MQNILAKQSTWHNVPIIMLMLAGVAVLTAAITSGCGPNDATIHQCLDAGTPDGGDAGVGGGDPLCN
jgi:hypothetical protein